MIVRVANLADRSAPTLAKWVARRAMTEPGEYGLPDVVLFSECSTVDLRTWGDLWGFDVLQYGTPGSSVAGTAVGVRRETARRHHKGRRVLGSPATGEGGGIRDRWLVSDVVSALTDSDRKRNLSVRMWSGHAPPPRSPLARAAFVAAARLLGAVQGCDYNLEPSVLRATVTRKVRAIGVLGLLVPRHIRASVAAPCDIGSDHPAVDVVLYPANHKESP